MAQQMPFQSGDSDDQQQAPGAAETRGTQLGGRYTETPANNFVGGGIDKTTGNLRQGSEFQANRGSKPTMPEPPKAPAPATPTTPLAKLDAPPPPQQLPTQQVQPFNPPKEQGGSFWSTLGGVAMIAFGLFCYARGTLVRRHDGSWVAVEDIEVGDQLAMGGAVLAAGRAMTGELYEYRGTRVSGSHAVFEDGRFVRVEDSPQAIKLDHDIEKDLVYPVVTQHHLMVLETHVAADFAEVDGGQEMTSAQRLEAMNANQDRLRLLADVAGFQSGQSRAA